VELSALIKEFHNSKIRRICQDGSNAVAALAKNGQLDPLILFRAVEDNVSVPARFNR